MSEMNEATSSHLVEEKPVQTMVKYTTPAPATDTISSQAKWLASAGHGDVKDLVMVLTIAKEIGLQPLAAVALFKGKNIMEAYQLCLLGAEFGLTPPAALRGIIMDRGKPTISAQMLLGLALRHEKCKLFRIVESTTEKAVVEVLREGWPDSVRWTYTMEDAKVAGLANKTVWKQYPRQMLCNRAIAEAARFFFPETLFNVYLHGEIPAEGDE